MLLPAKIGRKSPLFAATVISTTATPLEFSKSKIDRIGDRLREEEISVDALRDLEAYRSQFSQAYAEVEHIVRDTLGHAITGRPSKSTVAIIEKLRRQKTRLSQIQDIAGCRTIVNNLIEQDSLTNALSVMLGDAIIDDKRSNPTNNYRAVHIIAKRHGKIIEVQIRTKAQHFWAELSEKLADTYGQDLKYGKGNEKVLQVLKELSVQIRKLEQLHAQKISTSRVRSGSTASRRTAKRQASLIDTQIRHIFYGINQNLSALQYSEADE